MNYQQVENLLIRYRNQAISLKTISGGIYEGTISDVTNDYVALKTQGAAGEDEVVIVLLHSIESIRPRASR
jgi:hypothetical protein